MKGKMQSLSEALRLSQGEMVTVVGAGGKTSIILCLSREINGRCIITTSTNITQITEIDNKEIMLENETNKFNKNWDQIKNMFEEIWHNNPHSKIVIGKKKVKLNSPRPIKKIKGVPKDVVDKFASLCPEVNILVEGDGAARKYITTPADYEPVVPLKTDILIPVLGMKALGRKINKRYCHRTKLLKKLNGDNNLIDDKLILKILTDKSSYGSYIEKAKKYIPILNHVTEDNIDQIKRIAKKIVDSGVRKVILVNTRNLSPVIEIID